MRTACVWCPDWPVVAWRRRDGALGDGPLAVLEPSVGAPVVRAASPEARSVGVRIGMRRREAEARCPGLTLVDADLPGEVRAFEVVARAVERFTPRVELDRAGRLSFPTRGPSRYFGGDEALAASVHTAVRDAGIEDVRVGIADGRLAARLAARRERVVAPGESAAFLAPWPVDVLGDPDLAGLLARLGLPTLGAFAALPAPAVLARFGPDGRRWHRWAGGLDDDPLELTVPPPDLVETHEFDPPVQRVDMAAFAAKSLADRLLERLSERGWACTRVAIEAETEHGERMSRTWRHDGALTPAALAERARWQLEGWLAEHEVPDDDLVTAGLVFVRLIPEEVVPLDGRQLGFWGGDQAAGDRAARALARVQGMLGHDAAVTPVVQGGRLPAERVRWVPWGEPREPSAPSDAPWPGAILPPAPARVFDPPLPAELLDGSGSALTVTGRGDASGEPAALRCAALGRGGGAVSAWAGPWTHDVRWWDRLARRRRALWHVVVDDVACLVSVEQGRAAVEAIYD
ncbi:MAG: DNA polymerase Y family protein [Acidimicrobiia bacterium]